MIVSTKKANPRLVRSMHNYKKQSTNWIFMRNKLLTTRMKLNNMINKYKAWTKK